MKKKIILVGVVIFNLWQMSSSKEKEVYKLDDIVVTATKIENKFSDLPFATNLILSEEIEKKPTLTIDHLLRKLPGVHSIRSHPSSYGVFITMRGQALTKQVVALNGQPINDGFNGYVRYSILPSIIWDRVEVIRGPYSSLFGPYAMGGVINFVPKDYLEENELKFQVGGFGIKSASLLYGKSMFKDKFNITIFAEDKEINGYVGDFVVLEPRTTAPSGTITQVTGWERTQTPTGKLAYKIGDKGSQYSKEHRSLYLGVKYKPTEKSEISLDYLYGSQLHGFSDERTYLKDLTGRPVNSGNVSFIDNGTTYYLTISPVNFLDMWGRCGQDVLNISYKHYLIDNLFFKLFGGLNTRVQKWAAAIAGATSSGGPGRKGTPEGISTRFGIESNISFPKNKLVVGAEMVLNSGGAKRELLKDWKDIDSVTDLEEDAQGKQRIASFYLVDEFSLYKNLSIWLGGRYDSWQKYDGKLITTYTITFPDETVNRFSPKLAISFKPFEFLNVKTSYGEGFRVPGPHELYRQVITPTSVSLANPYLKPEFNRCIDFGIEFYPSVVKYTKFLAVEKVKLNSFFDETKDLIYIKRWKGPHPDTGQQVDYTKRENAGRSENKGLELEIDSKKLQLPLGFTFLWSFNATLQDPRIKENIVDPKIVGKIVPYTPTEMYNLDIGIEKSAYFVTLTLHKRSKVYLNDDNSDVVNKVVGSMDPFTVCDLIFGYKISSNAKLSIVVTNLFDEKYYSMHNQLAPSRNISCELAVKF